MMEEDGYRWEDDVKLMRDEQNHWDSKNITKNWRKTLKKWAQKRKTRSKQWENRRKMMKEDEYG